MPYNPTYTYDGENRVKTVNGVTYTYDGDGNRVIKSNGTLYWGAGPLAESDLSATATSWKEYVFFNGKRVARRDASTSTVHYFFSNHVGSTSMITSSAGAIEEDLDYYPYGGIAYGTSSDHYMFDGKERDSETGNDNFGARYYGSGMGRFLTPDWAERPTAIPYAVFGDPQSLNLYGFVRNDPVSLADLDGHQNGCVDKNENKCVDPPDPQKDDREKANKDDAEKAQNQVQQVPTSLRVESQKDMTRSDPKLNYGIFTELKYQVLDQNGKPIQSDKMQTMEHGTFGDGGKYAGPIVSKKPGENHTQPDGTFTDKPVGHLQPRPMKQSVTIDQTITIVMDGKDYTVRTQTFTVTSGGYGQGRITNNLGDIDVKRP